MMANYTIIIRDMHGGHSPDCSVVEGLLCTFIVALFAWQFYRAWRATKDDEGGHEA
jgi:hypothetical protein